MTKYTVKSRIDLQEYGTFDTRREAMEQIRSLKEFDRENGNPFEEGYFVEKEEI